MAYQQKCQQRANDDLPAYQAHLQTTELIILEKIIKIDAEAFECDTKMFPEIKVIEHAYIVVFILWILKQK